jgi:hypothetical protein
MAETGTTSLNNLPNELKGENKVVLNVTEKNKKIGKNTNNQQTQLSPDSINQIVQGLQKASQSNLTSLPTKDIPMTNQNITHDREIQPNFIPETKHNDYIGDSNTFDSLMNQSQKKSNERDRLDILYDELQMPLLAMILYFFLQLPYFQKLLVNYFPSLFLRDGNPNLYGYLFKTIIFGTYFYSITKFSKYMSEF